MASILILEKSFGVEVAFCSSVQNSLSGEMCGSAA